MKILVIEDEDLKFNTVQRYLSELNEFDITRAKSRNAGLREFTNQQHNNTPYDLVICDNYMPLYDNEYNTTRAYGIDIVNHIRCRDDKTFICMCSSGELESAEYNYSILYDSSVYLYDEFKTMLNLAKNHTNN